MELRKLHDTFGAEVRGLDLLGSVAESDIGDLREALAEHQLLLFRLGGRMPPERQVDVAGWFGPVATNGEKPWSILRNDSRAGADRLPFHCDFTYTDAPIQAISLHAIELPQGGTSTSFVSGVHAWASLPPELQDKLSPMTVRHVHDSSIVAADMPVFVADQPVRFEHPRAGKPVLLVTEYHARRINELSPEASEALLRRLFADLYQPQRIYEHQWRLHDLLIWDNLAVQHARRAQADPGEGARALQRVVSSNVDYAELVERARRRQAAGAFAG